MTQTWALFVESYRHLNAKKLFWIALVISGLIVAAFAMVGIDEEGLSILVWRLPIPVSTAILSADVFYKLMFLNLGVTFWLAWGATILALVSTAGVMPEFLAGGAVDVTLAKPISRLRLFLTKYAAAMLFVGLQVGVFSTASFLVIGLRGGSWEPSVFLAVPIVVVFFSYLYSICTLLGVVTRSTVAALLLTMLVWLGLFAVNSTEAILLMVRTQAEQSVQWLEGDIASREQALAAAADGPAKEGIMNTLKNEMGANKKEAELATRRTQLEDARKELRTISIWQNSFVAVKTALPKTSETIGLLERWMVDMADLPAFNDGGDGGSASVRFDGGDRELPIPQDHEAVERAVIEKARSRSVAWIVGTSLIFEAFVVGIAAWIFCRRDF